MKMEYVKPKTSIDTFETVDVVTTSITEIIPDSPISTNTEIDLDHDDSYDINIK